MAFLRWLSVTSVRQPPPAGQRTAGSVRPMRDNEPRATGLPSPEPRRSGKSGFLGSVLSWSVLLALTYLTLELLSFAAYLLAAREGFSFAAMRQRREAILGEETDVGTLLTGAASRGGWTFEGIILHPYLGYSRDRRPSANGGNGLWPGPDLPSPDQRFTIALTGGSAAEGFFTFIRRDFTRYT